VSDVMRRALEELAAGSNLTPPMEDADV